MGSTYWPWLKAKQTNLNKITQNCLQKQTNKKQDTKFVEIRIDWGRVVERRMNIIKTCCTKFLKNESKYIKKRVKRVEFGVVSCTYNHSFLEEAAKGFHID